MERNKIIIVSLLISLILIMSSVVFLNRDTLFQSSVTLEYVDGCKEVYKNTELVSPVCENGRAIAENNNKDILWDATKINSTI